MTTHSHSLPVTISVGGDEIEIAAEIDFTIKPGSSDSWECPGDPAEIEIEKVELTVPDPRGKKDETVVVSAPDWLFDFLSNSAAVYEALGEASGWGEDDGPDPDEAYERARDEKMERMR